MITYELLKENTFRFFHSIEVDGVLYKFSKQNPPTMIASALAVMFLGLWDKIKLFSPYGQDERHRWANYFNSFQNVDGFFEDEDIQEKYLMPGYTRERALFHRTRHVLFALNTLGYKTKHRFHFLDDMLQPLSLMQWLEKQDLSNYWDVSNKLMDLCLFLHYEGTAFKNSKAFTAIESILDFCDQHTHPKTGYHDSGKSDLRNAMAGAMHLYPIYFLMKRKPKYPEAIVKTTLSLQNEDGFFGYEVGSCGEDCLDYDAALILVNFYPLSGKYQSSIENALKKLLLSLEECINPDGGFCCHRRKQKYRFGTFLTEVEIGGSSLWSTYARLLTIAMATQVLKGHSTFGPWRLGNNIMEMWNGSRLSGDIGEWRFS